MEIKKILVPVDGSEASERAFSYGAALAAPLEAEVILYYVVDAADLLYPVYRVTLAETDTNSVEANGRKYIDELAKKAPEGVRVVPETDIGAPAQSIVRKAEDEKVDLIVMGNSGKGAVSSIIMGSVSHYVIHHTKVPVLIIK